MVQLRRILSLVVCFSVCLIVCVSPVFAANSENVNGYYYWQSGTVLQYINGSNNIDILSGYFPSTFSASSTSNTNRLYNVVGSELPFDSNYGYTFKSNVTFYVEVLFPVSSPLSVSINSPWTGSGSNPLIESWIGIGDYSASSTTVDYRLYAEDAALIVDNEVKPLLAYQPNNPNNHDFDLGLQEFNVARYYGYRFYFNPASYTYTPNLTASRALKFSFSERQSSFTFSGANVEEGVWNELIVNTGVLQEINGSVSEININTEKIMSDVSDIKDTVSDTHDQLENPNSNIWQAAGSAISGAIESLFVPSEQDIANVKHGFDDLAQDKLGGAYTAMETVEDTIIQVNDKLNNPSAAEGVEFPGIAVPLGGEVGTVVLAERQMVTLPMELTAILHPLGGTIISIIAGLGTFNVLKDMVECFLSGFSYAEYLHRNKGGSDE